MNEADTPDNGALREPPDSASAAQPENTGCPFYSVVPNQRAIPKLPPARIIEIKPCHEYDRFQIDGLENTNDNQNNNKVYIDSEHDQVLTLGNEQWESQTLSNEDTVSETSDIPPADDWVAEPDREKQAAIDTEFQQLLALNQELQAANDKLYNQVEELTSTLTESEKALQLQKKRSSVTETMLNQQTQELTATQKQIESLYQQLETSQQNVQRQETLIETYKAQFEFSLSRLAQLERECALLQTTHNEQSQHLLQSETACRELRTRLMRQQRQTLQFKAALEKCLDPIPTSSEDLTEDNFGAIESNEYLSPSLKKFRSLFVNADPIRPWSADQETPVEESENMEDTTSPTNDAVTLESESKPELFTASDSIETTTSEAPANSASPSLEAQIDSVIKMFFSSQSNSTSQQMPFQLGLDEDEEIESDTSESPGFTNMRIEDSATSDIWDAMLPEDTQTILPLEIECAIPGSMVAKSIATPFDSPSNNTITVKSDSVIESNDIPIYAEPVIETASPNAQDESEDYWAEVSQLTHLDLPATDSPLHPSHDTNDEKSPSPVVYPKRPPKGRKSLASVELPKFRPPQS